MKRRVAPIARAIEPVLEPANLDSLKALFHRFVEEGGRTNLQRWSSATEKTACRVGLVLSNDLMSAAQVLERSEGKLGELARDLITYVTSERYAQIRRSLGIALTQN
jgi:hypothetical protein